MKRLLHFSFGLILILSVGFSPVCTIAGNPIEVGDVKWGRDFKGSLAESTQTKRPVLVLFQEIPGCSGCQSFGQDVLTHPLLVEAIEEAFVPMLVYNNRGGEDAKLLKRYKEPAWNFQVIRFLNAQGRDLIPRKDRIWSLEGVASRMVKALKAARRPVPSYLQALGIDSRADSLSQCAFAMPCFWTGERKLGKINGVVRTEAGFLDGHEVVRVRYDSDTVSLRSLAEKARAADCADVVYASDSDRKSLRGFSTGRLDAGYRKAPESDQKKQLTRAPTLRQLNSLTDMQKTKLNAFLGTDRERALKWLSPRQRKAFAGNP